jgi:hypothetical protein
VDSIPQRVSSGQALAMALTGALISTGEAHAIGLVDRRAPAGAALDEAIRPRGDDRGQRAAGDPRDEGDPDQAARVVGCGVLDATRGDRRSRDGVRGRS